VRYGSERGSEGTKTRGTKTRGTKTRGKFPRECALWTFRRALCLMCPAIGRDTFEVSSPQNANTPGETFLLSSVYWHNSPRTVYWLCLELQPEMSMPVTSFSQLLRIKRRYIRRLQAGSRRLHKLLHRSLRR
jgi:hypothetical protein